MQSIIQLWTRKRREKYVVGVRRTLTCLICLTTLLKKQYVRPRGAVFVIISRNSVINYSEKQCLLTTTRSRLSVSGILVEEDNLLVWCGCIHCMFCRFQLPICPRLPVLNSRGRICVRFALRTSSVAAGSTPTGILHPISIVVASCPRLVLGLTIFPDRS